MNGVYGAGVCDSIKIRYRFRFLSGIDSNENRFLKVGLSIFDTIELSIPIQKLRYYRTFDSDSETSLDLIKQAIAEDRWQLSHCQSLLNLDLQIFACNLDSCSADVISILLNTTSKMLA